MSTDQPDLPERFEIRSADPLAERIDVLRATFPEAFREDKVDVDALTRSLGEWVDPGPERFGLTWPGKTECMRVIQEPSLGALVPMPEESVDWDTTQNVIIEGENLEVLKLLQKAYYGKVKMIYIDPPYNTGKEFIYPDNFREGLADYLKYSGQVDDAGFKTSANTETGGRYHSKWLSMMYPRLFLARNLLRDDGVIFVTIDDHEIHNLRALMNEVFGEENFVASIIWQKVYSPKNTAKYFSEDHDYILCFARSLPRWTPGLIPRSTEATGRYSNPDSDPRGAWKPGDVSARNYYSKGTYPIECPGGRTIPGPPAGTYWRYSEEKLAELSADGRIWWGPDGNGMPAVKRFLTEVRDGIIPQTLWKYQDVGHTQEAKKQLLDLVSFDSSDTVFDTPKPTRLIERMLQIATTTDQHDIVLDFFAGSGTTGDAISRLNSTDFGNRRYILVQLPEPTGDSNMPTISSMVRSRVRASNKRILESATQPDSLDLGFRAYRLSASSFKPWLPSSGSIDELTEQLTLNVANSTSYLTSTEVAHELALKAGFPLTSPIDELVLKDDTVTHSVNGGVLLLLIDGTLTMNALEEMIARSPSMIIVADGVFPHDEAKVNALQTVRAHNRREETDLTLRIV